VLELAAEHGFRAASRRVSQDGRELLSRRDKQGRRFFDGQRAQNFVTLRMTAELFRILDQFASAGIGALCS